MESKYGNIPDPHIIEYVNKLVNRVYKILPMKEEKSSTVNTYLESLLRELIGNKKLIISLYRNEDFVILIGTLQGLLNEDNIKICKSDIFKCITHIKRIKVALDGDT